MNTWANAVITEKGLALQAKLVEGNTLRITKAITGAGYVTPGLLIKQTEVSDPKQTLSIYPVSYPESSKCAVPVKLTNDGLASGYIARQVGVFANDPDEGEILYFIAQAIDEESGTVIPSETEMPGYSAEWTFYFQYGQADGVTVVVDPSNTVTYAVMEEYIDSEILALTYAEIDEAFGSVGIGGSVDTGDGGTTSGVGTLDHSLLYNRNISDQHTIESITGLEEALTSAEGEEITSLNVEDAWNEALADET